MKRFNITKRGYKFDKLIFWVVLIFTISLVIYNFYLHSFDFSTRAYLNCESPTCSNPYYLEKCQQQLKILFFIPLYTTKSCNEDPAYDWLQEKKLARGTYGEPPPQNFLYIYIRIIVLGILILAFLLNHSLHNRGERFDIEIRITKKLVINWDWLKEKFKNIEKE